MNDEEEGDPLTDAQRRPFPLAHPSPTRSIMEDGG